MRILGADANNLKGVNLDIPVGGITVVTGVSGSGKSSLLADTIAAEGARRTRAFLGSSQREFEREDVRAFISRMPPTVLVGQRGFRPSVRTTVATASGLLAVLRKLFLLEGRPWSDRLSAEVPEPNASDYAAWIAAHYRGPVEIWAVPVRSAKTDGKMAVAQLEKVGVDELRVYSKTDTGARAAEGRRCAVRGFKPLNPAVSHTIEALVAELQIDGPADEQELFDALDRAFGAGGGTAVVMLPNSDDEGLVGPFGARLDSSRHWIHPASPEVFYKPSAHLLSFNAPSHDESGACPTCSGTGVARRVRMDELVSHPDRSMRDGAFALWTPKNYRYVGIQHDTIAGLEGMSGFSASKVWRSLSDEARDLVLRGAGDKPVQDLDPAGRKMGQPRRFAGFEAAILAKASSGSAAAKPLLDFVEEGSCPACGGTRWSPQARAVRVGGRGLADILTLAITELAKLTDRRGVWSKTAASRSRGLVAALHAHAEALTMVGLGYLTGDRGMLEVSGGESRRVRLARVLEAGESGFCLLFDEPARGLHETDLDTLADAFAALRGRHTVVLNEHRQRLWQLADLFVEVGPKAGADGGRIVYTGSPRAQRRGTERVRTPLATSRRDPQLKIQGATLHNLDGVDVSLPLGRLTCVCGVSGSGKSSFVRGVLAPAVARAKPLEDFEVRARGRWDSVEGLEGLNGVVALDQTPPSPNRRSIVATASGVFDAVRKTFGSSPGAKAEGLTPSDFGLNGGGGRCGTCLGLGEVDDDGVLGTCPGCGGARWGPASLAVRVEGVNVRELMDTPVDRLEGADVFGIPAALVTAMRELGVGYLSLGRRIDTLSGGELQRLRLAMRLGLERDKGALFILDEPAAGLHGDDVRVLVGALDRVVDGGANTLIVVDHDLDVLRESDWIVEFGPGAGDTGGKVVFQGTPDQLKDADTPTGRALRMKSSSKAHGAAGTAPAGDEPPLDVQVRRTAALLRGLVGADVPPDEMVTQGVARPTARFGPAAWQGRDPWEIGGLELEVPKLLLDIRLGALKRNEEDLLERWGSSPGSWLATHPFISEMATWGAELPASVQSDALKRMRSEGLALVETSGSDALSARASGPRLTSGADEASRRATLRDALAIGGGHVELRSRAGKTICAAGSRLVNLERGLVGPMRPVPADFSRHDRRGRCPACSGTRFVASLDERLVFADKGSGLAEPGLLTPEADQITRGSRRAALSPLIKRLDKEGLWSKAKSFASLDGSARDVVLYGHWRRPGSGSFLKNTKVDPAEVSSWLRWDGLYTEILRELDRSKSAVWAAEIRRSRGSIPCTVCDATGLRPHAVLLNVAGVSFSRWATATPPARKLALLSDMEPATPRQKATHRRLVECLRPLGKDDAARSVLGECVEAFTTLQAVWDME